MRKLSSDKSSFYDLFEPASPGQSILHDTIGGAHPLMATIENAVRAGNYVTAAAAGRSVITLYGQGAIQSPRLAIAHEIEGDLLDIAQA